MVGSSPDNGETGRYCQTARARQARRKGATKVNQWLNSLKQDAGSNLVDVGRRQRTPPRDVWGGDFEADQCSRSGGPEEGLRRTWGDAAGEKLGAYPVNRFVVNVGIIRWSPSPPSSYRRGRAGPLSAVGRRVRRRVRSSPRPGKPVTWQRDPASRQRGAGMLGGRR